MVYGAPKYSTPHKWPMHSTLPPDYGIDEEFNLFPLLLFSQSGIAHRTAVCSVGLNMYILY